MTVSIVLDYWSDDAPAIRHVYATRELAEHAVSEYLASASAYERYRHHFIIEEYEVIAS